MEDFGTERKIKECSKFKRRAVTAAWKANNREKVNAMFRNWLKNHPENARKKRRRDESNKIKNLSDKYLKKLIRVSMKRSMSSALSEIPPSMLQAKRQHLIIRRLIREKLNEQKNT